MPDRPKRDAREAREGASDGDETRDPARADTLASDHGDGDSDHGTTPTLLPSKSSKTADESPGGHRRSGPRPVRSGDVLGRYELLEDVGEGGMATVYRARDRELRRDVAVKVLFPHLARRPDVVRRFDREARAAAGLEHENILRIYDVGGGEDPAAGDSHDPPYIVMELIRGSTLLGEIEQRGALLAEVVACIGALLADALVAAHAAGIIHRDIKPANILIAPGGRLLLADFGVARLETEDSLVTKTGALLGTPAYMSPEQASGDTATTKSDLYSIGATLYQLATGSLPYSGSPAKVLSLIASGSLVAPVRKRSSVGPDLSRLIEQLMANEPAARPASAAVVAAELRALAAAGGMGDATTELAAYFADPAGFLRERTPKVVTAIVTAATRAVAEQKLPRAMALADRASALAPDDPTVTALISTVTEGGRASHRRRILAFAGLGVGLAGGVLGAVAWSGILDGTHAVGHADAVIASAPIDAPTDAPTDSLIATSVGDAGVALDDATRLASTQPDAVVGGPRLRDAGARRLDAGVVDVRALPLDAALAAAPLDAAVLPPDAPAARGTIIVENDTWCDITIDGIAKGQTRNQPHQVEPGHHQVTCEQKALAKRWTQEVDVAPGQTRRVKGQLLEMIEITVQITRGVSIGGTLYINGAHPTLRASRYEVIVPGGSKKYMDLRRSCTLRDQPELECL